MRGFNKKDNTELNLHYTKSIVMKKSSFQLILICPLLILGLLISFWPVRAQGAILAVDPENISLPLGSQLLIELDVIDGENINGFDITLNYDDRYLSLVYWLHGGYLQNVSCLQMINEPGLFQLACQQINRPETSGDGILIELAFDTQDEGLSEVRIVEAEFLAADGTITRPEREQGLVDILDLPTYTPTPTATRTPTITPTPRPTNTPTPTQTFTATSTFTPAVTATFTPIASATATTITETPTQALTEPTQGTADAGQGPDLQPSSTPAPNFDQTQPPQNEETQVHPVLTYLLWGIIIVSTAVFLIVIISKRRRKSAEHPDDLL